MKDQKNLTFSINDWTIENRYFCSRCDQRIANDVFFDCGILGPDAVALINDDHIGEQQLRRIKKHVVVTLAVVRIM